MSAAEATGPRFSPFNPGRATGTRPSPKPRPHPGPPPLRVVPTPVDDFDEPPVIDAPRTRRIDWAAVGAGAGARTGSIGRTLYRDLVDAWVWRDVPPALRAIWATAATPPVNHPLLAAGWRVWMYGIAVPATAVGYTSVWLLQHPLRGIPFTASIAAAAATVWIN